jgi:nucleotide-binding universal stress UspA family protein
MAIDRILCPVDFSDCSRRALEYAAAMARSYDARVTALHVFADVPVVAPALPGFEGAMAVSLRNVDREAVAAAAERFVASVPASDVPIDTRVVEALNAADAIAEHGDTLNADLIVIGTHGRTGAARLLLGSTAGSVLRQSRRPVMTVPPHAAGHAPMMPFKRLLCPVDFSDTSLLALEWSLYLAEQSDGHLTVLHAIELPPDLQELPLALEGGVRAATLEHCRQRLDALVPAGVRTGCTVDTRVVEGRAHLEILRQAASDRSDLIVMGVRGRGPVDVALFGSNTNAVLHGAECPVVTVRLEMSQPAE